MSVAVAFHSRTGQTRRFIEKLCEELPSLEAIEIDSGWEKVDKPYVLVTPTYRFGNIPEEVEDFLETLENAENIVAVVSSGNMNWGRDRFAMSGDKISKWMNVPWLHKFELRGNTQDLEIVKEELIKINNKKDIGE